MRVDEYVERDAMELRTQRLNVILQTRQEVEQMIDSMSESEKTMVSAHWLALVRASKAAEPWVHGFRVVRRDSGTVVGTCGFKGPPADGVVEIAYGIDPEHQLKGYATEVARALVDYAFSRPEVRLVRAHTLPEAAASKRVLNKCGFRYVGETIDPDDGAVSRFERQVGDGQGTA